MDRKDLDLRQREMKLRLLETRHRATTELLAQGVRAILLINGAGAVGLATLFQVLVDKQRMPSLLPAVIWGIGFCVLGVAFAVAVVAVRYAHWNSRDPTTFEDGRWTKRLLWLQIL